MKGHGLALHGSRPHLHILARIDRLLPCLHDLSCVFMCAGALWSLIGLTPGAGDICFAENIRNTSSRALLTDETIQAKFSSISTKGSREEHNEAEFKTPQTCGIKKERGARQWAPEDTV